MVVKKRRRHPERQFVVSCCFGCGALIGQGERNHVSLFWGDGDPGHDEVVVSSRETVVRMCFGCRREIEERGALVVRLGGLRIQLTLDECNEKSKTGAHGILRTRVVRRLVK